MSSKKIVSAKTDSTKTVSAKTVSEDFLKKTVYDTDIKNYLKKKEYDTDIKKYLYKDDFNKYYLDLTSNIDKKYVQKEDVDRYLFNQKEDVNRYLKNASDTIKAEQKEDVDKYLKNVSNTLKVEIKREIPAGPTGPLGPMGPMGPMGPQGQQGPIGLTGPAGLDGIQGLVGPQGPQGLQGPIGLTGPAGIDGIPGLVGPVGPMGPMGPMGNYESAVDFVLGSNAAPERGPVGPARALVRDGGSALTVNYDNDFTGGVNINAKGGLRVNGNTKFNGEVNASGNVIMDGDNSWILHTPDDGRKTLYLAPLKDDKSDWNWGTQTKFEPDGSVNIAGNTNIAGTLAAGKFSVNNNDNGLTINAMGEAGKGRMHVTSEDELYVLNKKGLIVGKEWGGSGNVNIQGNIVAAGEPHDDWTGLNVKRRDGRWTHFDWKDDQKNYIRGDTIVDGDVGIPSGKALTIRDQYHGLAFADDMDGPALYGYGGGKLRVAGNAQGETPVDTLKWTRSGIDVTGDVKASNNIIMDGDNSWILHTPDDGRKTLYLAPRKDDKADWNWGTQTKFEPDGSVWVPNNFGAKHVNAYESTTSPHIKNIPDGNKWSWFQAQQTDGDVFFGGDPTNKGIWADGDRPFTIYRNGKAVTKFEAGGIDVTGNANISGNIGIPSGKALTIRDQYHGLAFADDMDGPSLYGYGGGKLRVSGNAQGETAVDTLKWTRSGVDVTGNANISGNIKLTNTNSEICIGPRWCIVAEGADGQNLVFRDKLSTTDSRYYMAAGKYVDI
jgi:hypothetical protein